MFGWSWQIEDQAASSGDDPTFADLRAQAPVPRDFAIDQTTGKLAIPMRLTDGDESTAQRLMIALQFNLGEWFLDLREGIPYLRSVYVHSPNKALIDALFKRVIVGVYGIARVESYTSTIDKRTRTYAATFRARTARGGLIAFTSKPFIVGES